MSEPKVRTVVSTLFQRDIGASLHRVHFGGEHLVVTSWGRPQFAVVDALEYEQMVDARRFLEALREQAAHEARVLTENGAAQ